MSTYGGMKTAIARRLVDAGHTAVTDVEIGEAINDAVFKWKNHRFWFNTTSSALAITAGDSSFTLPSDFLIEVPRNAITVTDSGFPYRVEKVSASVFDLRGSSTTTGRPLVYCNRNGALPFYPAANIDYAGIIYYLKDYDAFQTGGTEDNLTNDFLTEGSALIQSEALANLHGELRMDTEMEERYTARTAQAYTDLLIRTNKLLKTGTLTVEQ